MMAQLKTFAIAVLLLSLPVLATIYVYYPRYHIYTALGEIVSVQELGVDGSVHFVYVLEGVTSNIFEKHAVKEAYPDAKFQPAGAWALEYYESEIEIGEELRLEAIQHAVDSAEDAADLPVSVEIWDARLDELIEESGGYYGDSIGLMLGIGLIEEAKQLDFSRQGSITIAGTGTLEEDHTVGSVGSIRDKLRTAEKYGADIFFVPKDKETYPFEGLSNEEEAEQTAAELGLQLRVVPVSTLEEAVEYLSLMDGREWSSN